jgi:hypothetical protein
MAAKARAELRAIEAEARLAKLKESLIGLVRSQSE